MMKTLLRKEDLIFNPPQLGCVLSQTGLPGGGSTIYDRSPYGNIGTITGATWVRLPSGLWCLSFDGSDDEVNCGNPIALKITSAITIAAWINTTDVASHRAIIAKKSNPAATISTYEILHMNNSTIRWAGGNAGTAWQFDAGATPVATPGVFHHIVGTYKANIYAGLYYNSELKAEDTSVGQVVLNDSFNWLIGQRGDNTNRYKGSIALLRIYNRALTALEIQNLFNREKHLFGVW